MHPPSRPLRRSIPPVTLHGRATRRTFLLGALAGGVLAACSSDDDSSEGGSDGTLEPGSVGQFTLVQRFPQGIQVPGELRLPFSLSTGAAELVQDGPETLGAQVIDLQGNAVGERITAIRRDVAPAPYYAFRPTIEEPGVYGILIDGGPPEGASFDVAVPENVPVPVPGELLPGFDTPTVGNPGGIDPICTRTPEMCPFHTISLADALNVGRPIVYYVGTPALCSTGSCGPALEAMMTAHDAYVDTTTFIHAEVFTDDTGTQTTPAVQALDLFYEPALFVTDAEGVIVERLDGLFDETELVEVLDSVTA